MMLLVFLFLYAGYSFVKSCAYNVTHDVGVKVFDDRHSAKRERQESKAIWSFVRCIIALVLAGYVGMCVL